MHVVFYDDDDDDDDLHYSCLQESPKSCYIYHTFIMIGFSIIQLRDDKHAYLCVYMLFKYQKVF